MMDTGHEIFYDENRLCITLARGEGLLKGFDAPSNKHSALLYHSATLTEIPWQSLQMIGDRCCLVFMPTDMFQGIPVDASHLATSLRSRSLNLLRDLSHALEEAGNRLFWNLDSIPLSNILFFENGDILLLSDQMGDALDRFEADELRRFDKNLWYAHNCVEGFGKANFLFQLLYYTLSGIAPFEAEAVRENSFKAVPLSLLFPPCDAKLKEIFDMVDRSLSDDRKFQFSIRKPFSFFRNIIDGLLQVGIDNINVGPNPDLDTYRQKLEKRAKIRIFIRKKGVKTFFIALGVALVLSIVGFYVWRAVKPPVTKDLNEVQIIEYYYDALTNLNATDLLEPLKNGYDGPDFVEVSSLYVTSTMQKTYDGASLIVDPRKWIADGMGDLPRSSIVYGVSDLQITKVSDDVYRVIVHLWSSSNYVDDANNLIVEDGMDVYEYYQTNEFTFTSRGSWREVSKIEQLGLELVATHHINYSN